MSVSGNPGHRRYIFGGDGRWWLYAYTGGDGDARGWPIASLARHHHRGHHGPPHPSTHHHLHNAIAGSKPNQGHRRSPASLYINPWSGEPIDPRDGMADRPMLQALFHSNAGLQHFYYTPYEVAAFVAAPFAAMFLVSPFFTLSAGAVLLSKHRNCKAFAAADVILHDFIYGTSTRQRFYYQSSVDTQSLMQSQGIHEALRQIRQQRRMGQTHGFGYTDSWQALAYIPHDLLYSPVGGQVGGDTWEWGLDSGRIQMHVHNDAGANSFFFHAVPNLPDGLNAPFNTVHQDFSFSVPDE